MNPIPRRKSAIPTDSDCGSVVAVMGACRITATDRPPMGNESFRNGRLPSNLAKDIGIGIGWVAVWATSFFLRTSLYLGVKVVTKLQACLVLLGESRRWGALRATCALGIDCGCSWRVWVRLNSSTDSSLLVDGPWRSDSCGQHGCGMYSMCRYYGFRARNEQSVAASLTLLKQVVNTSELIPDEAQPSFEIRKGGWWSQALAPRHPQELVKPSS